MPLTQTATGPTGTRAPLNVRKVVNDTRLDYVADVARSGAAGRTLLSNSIAFGGTDATPALRAMD